MLHPFYQNADLQQQLGFLSDPLEIILFCEIRPLKMNSFMFNRNLRSLSALESCKQGLDASMDPHAMAKGEEEASEAAVTAMRQLGSCRIGVSNGIGRANCNHGTETATAAAAIGNLLRGNTEA